MGLGSVPKALDKSSRAQAEGCWEKGGWKNRRSPSSSILSLALLLKDHGLRLSGPQGPCLCKVGIGLENFEASSYEAISQWVTSVPPCWGEGGGQCVGGCGCVGCEDGWVWVWVDAHAHARMQN